MARETTSVRPHDSTCFNPLPISERGFPSGNPFLTPAAAIDRMCEAVELCHETKTQAAAAEVCRASLEVWNAVEDRILRDAMPLSRDCIRDAIRAIDEGLKAIAEVLLPSGKTALAIQQRRRLREDYPRSMNERRKDLSVLAESGVEAMRNYVSADFLHRHRKWKTRGTLENGDKAGGD